jgi:poly(A) polymerase Pap1
MGSVTTCAEQRNEVAMDWEEKIKELKKMAEELDYWASKSEGRQRLVLGRMADELRQFVGQVQELLENPDGIQKAAGGPIPDWLASAEGVVGEYGEGDAGEYVEEAYWEDEGGEEYEE